MFHVVHPDFRSIVLRYFPCCRAWRAGLSLLTHLLLSGHREGNGVLVDRYTLAAIEGCLDKAKQKTYSGVRFLREFQERCFPDGGFRWSDHRYVDGKCRVAHVDWPGGLLTELEQLNAPSPDELVLLDTGSPASAANISYRRIPPTTHPVCSWHVQHDILNYLNSLKPQSFAPLRNNLAHAWNVASDLAARGELSRCGHVQTKQLLVHLSTCSRSMYRTIVDGNTDRLFACGESLCGLKKEVRQAYCAGWWDADLKNAQLAIVAKLWDIPEVTRFLETGRPIWSDLACHLGLETTDLARAKPILKEALYSLIYGMKVAGLTRGRLADLRKLGVSDPSSFFSHPVIAALLAAREVQFEKIRCNGGLFLCHGKWIDVSADNPTLLESNIRSALARQAQAVELQLIYPVYELAQKTQDFKVMLHQHDGVCITFRRRAARWRERINETVAGRAAELGIVTKLEWEELRKPAEGRRLVNSGAELAAISAFSIENRELHRDRTPLDAFFSGVLGVRLVRFRGFYSGRSDFPKQVDLPCSPYIWAFQTNWRGVSSSSQRFNKFAQTHGLFEGRCLPASIKHLGSVVPLSHFRRVPLPHRTDGYRHTHRGGVACEILPQSLRGDSHLLSFAQHDAPGSFGKNGCFQATMWKNKPGGRLFFPPTPQELHESRSKFTLGSSSQRDPPQHSSLARLDHDPSTVQVHVVPSQVEGFTQPASGQGKQEEQPADGSSTMDIRRLQVSPSSPPPALCLDRHNSVRAFVIQRTFKEARQVSRVKCRGEFPYPPVLLAHFGEFLQVEEPSWPLPLDPA